MATTFNRRHWLKSSIALSGGLVFGSSLLAAPEAAADPEAIVPARRFYSCNDERAMNYADPALRARLLANENPFGPSPKARQAIIDAIGTSYQYPFREKWTVADKIMAREGLKEEQLLFAPGSTPLLLAAAINYCKGNIITANPSYDDLTETAATFGAKIMKVALTPQFSLDLDAMEQAVDETTSLVYICNPNNPTATVVDAAKLKAFCERVSKKTMVFVDEAYIDLVPNPDATSMIGLVKAGVNIIVARTFSKLYGMAGLRFGYVAAQPETIRKLERYSINYSISATTLAAADASYQDKEFMKFAYDKIGESKQYLFEALKKNGYEGIPSSTNFAMFEVRMDATKFTDLMMKEGVGVRNWRFNGKEWCRVSIGKMEEMKIFAEALKKVSA